MPQHDTTADDHNALVQFILGLFGDQARAEAFNENSMRCLADAGLKDVTPQDVRHAVAEVAQTIPAPAGNAAGSAGGGIGHWEPQIPSHGSAVGIIQNITNNYHQQFNTIIGDNNHLDARQTNATGEGSVAVGGDNHGDIATTEGTAGDNNKTHNTEDKETTNVDRSVHGDNSGNSSAGEVVDNSDNDSHDTLEVTTTGNGGQSGTTTGSTPAGAAVTTPPATPSGPGPFHPTPIGIDPMPATLAVAAGGDLDAFQQLEAFSPVPQTLVSDAAPIADAARPVTMTSEDLISEHGDAPGPGGGAEGTADATPEFDPAAPITLGDALADPTIDHAGIGGGPFVDSSAPDSVADISYVGDTADDGTTYDAGGTGYVPDSGVTAAAPLTDATVGGDFTDGP
ncbi:IniB N-terminal domain-containing protein [Gordonia insulae]|uniref:Uncharacterized protein n=1 Tax=Gordonia insulae TaxID=2420509 RepID=A0A3G8JI03_9ACTN|nr:IniB N-terminal domain-containing protein [Gordonia insulae]AZG44548.1 hypothetical protein D7316_01134 [Gordonia insulae]